MYTELDKGIDTYCKLNDIHNERSKKFSKLEKNQCVETAKKVIFTQKTIKSFQKAKSCENNFEESIEPFIFISLSIILVSIIFIVSSLIYIINIVPAAIIISFAVIAMTALAASVIGRIYFRCKEQSNFFAEIDPLIDKDKDFQNFIENSNLISLEELEKALNESFDCIYGYKQFKRQKIEGSEEKEKEQAESAKQPTVSANELIYFVQNMGTLTEIGNFSSAKNKFSKEMFDDNIQTLVDHREINYDLLSKHGNTKEQFASHSTTNITKFNYILFARIAALEEKIQPSSSLNAKEREPTTTEHSVA